MGHSTRYLLMNAPSLHLHIIVASTIAAFVIGVLAVLASPLARTPAEACLFPSLLPMIPGMYAYRAFGALAMCLWHNGESTFDHYFYLFANNGLTCLVILLGMVVGATLPIFIFSRISFQATR